MRNLDCFTFAKSFRCLGVISGLLTFLLLPVKGLGQPAVAPRQHPKINLFSLADVRLLDGEFKHIQDLDHQYLLTLEPDRMAAWFRREAGLTPKAQPYPFWESDDVWGKGPLAGHIMGFYLSSMAMMYQSTGDKAILDRLTYTLNELNVCQQAQGDGYLLATINGRKVFEQVAAGNFTTSNPLINDTWEPVYIMNKIMLGLYGVHTRCQLPLAKDMLVRMADWFGKTIIDKLSHDQMQKLLVCEHGSINESFVDVYTVTGDKKYLAWAEKLNDEDMWVPLSQGKDVLEGWHANTQIPKFTGFERIYDFTGEQKFTNASRFFWKTVVDKHTWANGGNSTGEHFFPTKDFARRVSLMGGPESCNSVNMLRLTESLYRDYAEPEKIDYYEKVLFNHVLANYDPEQGMCTYYTSVRPGNYRIYGTKYDSFWCCTGTGFESPAKFGQMIYAYDANSLYVNLFMPSRVNWVDKGVTLTQKTRFPDKDQTELTLSGKQLGRFSLKIRHPHWVQAGQLAIRINGKATQVTSQPGGYAELNRIWKTGDEVTVSLPTTVRAIPLPETDRFVAIQYGPIIMGATVDNHGLTKEDFRSERDFVASAEIPLIDAPTFRREVTNIPAQISRTDNPALTLRTSAALTGNPVNLVPVNRIHFNRYTIYFQRLDSAAIRRETALVARADEQQQLLEKATVDKVTIGDKSSEENHRLEGVSSASGRAFGKAWRHATNGGYFMYNLTVAPDEAQQLYLSFSKSDAGKRVFDVLIDGKLLQTLDHSKPVDTSPSQLYGVYLPLPADLIQGKKNITIKFQAKDGNTAGGLFDVRTLKSAGMSSIDRK